MLDWTRLYLGRSGWSSTLELLDIDRLWGRLSENDESLKRGGSCGCECSLLRSNIDWSGALGEGGVGRAPAIFVYLI